MTDPDPDYHHGERPLARYGAEAPAAESWMLRALEHEAEVSTVEVEGCAIETRTWGGRGLPGLVFVHGGVAHARWWDFTAPFFAGERRCLALSLSGMGGSGWREEYAHELYAAEVLAAAEAAGLFDTADKPLIVGHSFGGLVAVQTLQRHTNRFAGAVIVDSPVIPLERRLLQERRRDRAHKPQPTLGDAIGRFRLMPDEPSVHPFILHHVAWHGIVETAGGFTWSFDPNLWGKMNPRRGHPDFAAVAGRVSFIRGEHSTVVGPDSAAELRRVLGPGSPFVEVPEAWHHVPLNRPLAFVSALRALLGAWEPARLSAR